MQPFQNFYKELTGYDPFPWQSSLATRVANEGNWPTMIDIPTGGGKTGIIFIAAWLSEQGLAPRRLVWIIDRRIVVDQVHNSASSLASRGWDIITLRGGVMPRDINPARRTIIASTVDQIGSRILWQPYGQSRRTAAIHAGLVLQDCMLFLDEAHLSRPFVDVVRHIGIPYVELTATPADASPGTLFSLDTAQMGHLKKRMTSPKFVRVGGGMITEAKALLNKGYHTIGLICNTAKEARKVYSSLSEFEEAETILITGRQRQYERDEILKNWLPHISAGREKNYGKPVFVVATSAIEVGADLDFDALVTECPAQDALYQRIGRCNRTGRNRSSEIIISKPTTSAKVIYGQAAVKTWDWLKSLAPKNKPATWTTAELPEIMEEMRTPVAKHPVLTKANQLSLLLTKLDIGPYLHGWTSSADVNIVWRADLPVEKKNWREVIELCPPATGEQLSIPYPEAVEWLGGRDTLIWTADDDDRPIMAGDVIIVPSSYGGIDEWGWSPACTQHVKDIAEIVERKRIVWRFPDEELSEEEASDRLGKAVRVRSALGSTYTVAWIDNQWSYTNELLSDHTEKVVRFLNEILEMFDSQKGIESTSLTKCEQEALRNAALWHDQGKSHPVWQTAASGHPFSSSILGKTERLNAKLLKGFRHDRESASMAKESGENELVQSLVATHHGRDIPRWLDTITNQSGGIARWAYLSSILRFADQNVDL